MPQLDKTGPEGKGPTGLGRGGCKQTSANPQGRGAGRGRGRDFYPYYEATKSPLSLTDEEKILQERLAEVQEALKEEEST